MTVGQKVFANVIWSQIKIHQPWGGVVPSLARREHRKHLDQVIDEAIKRANITSKRLRLPRSISWQTINALAVTQGPGLAIALEVGIEKAKKLSQKYHKPLIAINHMEGHLLSPLALNSRGAGSLASQSPQFPILGFLASGGHTELVLVKSIGQYQLLGETLDDAAGEAFDKVAKMLNLGYPGGPIIEELAKKGNPDKFDLPIPMVHHPSLNFSFSGLKTACLYRLKKIPESKKNKKFLQDFSASFQKVLVQSIIIKLGKAIQVHSPAQIFLGGGVISNLYLRQQIRKTARQYQIPVFTSSSRRLFTDNAAMIGIAGFFKAQRGKFLTDIDKIDRKPNLSF